MTNRLLEPMLIAETDEYGDVAYVWIRADGDAMPRPVRNPKRHVDRINQYQIAGAAPADVIAWLSARAGLA